MYEVKKHRDKASLIDTYKDSFRARFGQFPVLDINTANEVANWALETLGFDRANSLLQGYLRLKDEWIESQGFPLEIFKKQINRVIANAPSQGFVGEDYVVWFSESGIPVLSKNPDVLKTLNDGKPNPYRPVLFSLWLKQTDDERLQYPRIPWSLETRLRYKETWDTTCNEFKENIANLKAGSGSS